MKYYLTILLFCIATAGFGQDVDELLDKGREFSKEMEFEKAFNQFTEIIKEYPQDARGYYERAWIKFLQEDVYGAIGDMNFALEFAPGMVEAYNKRGEAKYLLGDNFAAIDDFNKALELNPNLSDAFSNRAFAKFDLDDNEGAYFDFSEAIKLDSNNARFHNKRIFSLQNYNSTQ